MKESFLTEFNKRNYFNQCTNSNELEMLMNQKKIRAYIGFDCTSQSLHIGSLLQIMCLRLLQKYGHQPIVLLGGGTTRIGDPSGKEETRKLLSETDIDNNIKNIEKILKIFLKDKDKNTKPLFVNNYDWLKKLKYITFLRDIGKHFTINKMLSFDSVKLRLEREQSLSYMEFNYMILQAYDFLELNVQKNCVLQMGGSDQWGNIVNGVDLIKKYNNNRAYGLTTPLITLASGAKMGKTERGAIWLDKNLLSPYDYWQFWRNVDDKDVVRFLQMFTDLSLDKIDDLKNKNINELKILLANQTTKMLHGDVAAKNAEKTAKDTFQNRSVGSDLPSFKIKRKIIENEISIIDLFMLSKLLPSKSEIRRLIKNKGIRLNNEVVENEKMLVSIKDFGNDKLLKLSVGKKNHTVFKLV